MLGDEVIELCASAQRQLLLVAPFVKHAALERLLAVTSPETVVTCVTRWLPEDVAAGVSDLSVFELVSARAGARLLLHSRLHGKLFRADDRCLAGSANITGRALGWSVGSNVELLVPLPAATPEIVAFERLLLAEAEAATEDKRAAVRASAAALLASPFVTTNASESDGTPLRQWLPLCPSPELLWNAYASCEDWRLLSSALDLARRDLTALCVPRGLSREAMTQYVGSILAAIPLVQELDRRAAQGILDKDAELLIAAHMPSEFQYGPPGAWEVLKRWLGVYRPSTYRSVPTTEMLIRGRNLG